MIIIVCPYDFGLAMLRPYIIDIGRLYIAHSVRAVSGKQSSGLFPPYIYLCGLAVLRPYIIDIGRPYIAHSVRAVSGKQSTGLFTPYIMRIKNQ